MSTAIMAIKLQARLCTLRLTHINSSDVGADALFSPTVDDM